MHRREGLFGGMGTLSDSRTHNYTSGRDWHAANEAIIVVGVRDVRVLMALAKVKFVVLNIDTLVMWCYFCKDS